VRWIILLLWDPIEALDLADKQGRPDHGKVIGLVGFVALYLLILLRREVTLGQFIVLGSIIFGWASWRTFLASKAATATEATQRIVKLERDAKLGVEPTP